MINLFVCNRDLVPIGIIETYESVRWMVEYNGMGEFEIVASATENNLSIIKNDFYVIRKDLSEAGVIESVVIKDRKISVRGRMLNKFLDERIVLNQINVTDVESDIKSAIRANAIIDRPIEYLTIGPEAGVNDTANAQFTYDTLFEVINSFKNVGFTIILDIENKQLVFNMYKGKDKSNNVVFSDKLDNLTNEVITLDNKNYRNYAIIGGKGEGKDRKIVRYDARVDSSEQIREIFVDAKGVDEKKQIDENTERPYTDAEMTAILREKGIKALAEKVKKESFECDIVLDGNYTYKKDYYLGDIVSCINTAYNIKLKVRIIAIQEVYSSSESKVIATIGYNY